MADMAASTPGPTPVPLGPYCTAAGLNEDNVSQALPSIQPAVLNYGVVCELFQFIRKKHYPWQLVTDHLCQIYQCDPLPADTVRATFDRAFKKRKALVTAARRSKDTQPTNTFIESLYCVPGKLL